MALLGTNYFLTKAGISSVFRQFSRGRFSYTVYIIDSETTLTGIHSETPLYVPGYIIIDGQRTIIIRLRRRRNSRRGNLWNRFLAVIPAPRSFHTCPELSDRIFTVIWNADLNRLFKSVLFVYECLPISEQFFFVSTLNKLVVIVFFFFIVDRGRF